MKLLEIKGIVKRFKGLIAVNKVSFDINEGEIVGLIGPNGAGKSTLFDVISGIKPPDNSSAFPDSGEIYYLGKNIIRLPAYKRCKLGIGRTFQLARPLTEISVLDNIFVALLFSKDSTTSKQDLYKRAEEICNFVGLEEKINELARTLSVSNRKKLELARALATQPRLLLLDEIMAGLNPTEIFDANNLVKKIRESGITLIVIEHVMRTIMSVSDRIVVMDHGSKIAEGNPYEIASNQKVIEAYLGGKGEG